jgi:membrane fusion protein (multidrug efflux system)/multidrug resistance protein K
MEELMFLIENRHTTGSYTIKPLSVKGSKLRQASAVFISISCISFAVGVKINSFHAPSTNDAYISGSEVSIYSPVSGRVTYVNSAHIELVKKGDVLVRMDNTEAMINYKEAEKKLAARIKVTKAHYATLCLNNTNIMKAQMTYQQALNGYNRQIQSNNIALLSTEDLKQALKTVNSSKNLLDAAIRQYQQNQQLLYALSKAQQQALPQAAEELREASEALKHTEIRSPVNGYVTQLNVHAGATITPGQTLMSIVPADQLWIDANFKGPQVSNTLVGQRVAIITDQYGSDVVFDGVVEGINQRADIVSSVQSEASKWGNDLQRIPVRIAIDPIQMSQYPLRLGLPTQVMLLEGYSHLVAN